MYKKQRLDKIVSIIKEHGFVTVKFLTSALHYSQATINRDLNLLEGQKLVKRTYGGVEIDKKQYIPLLFRYEYMKAEKKKLGIVASKYINDGDTVFIDGSTTTEYIAENLTTVKDLTVITNNLALATYLSQYNIKVTILGGTIKEVPNIVLSEESIEQAYNYKVDKMFFSTRCITSDGEILTGKGFNLLYKIMMKNSKKVYYLCDHGKVSDNYDSTATVACDLSKIDAVISDFEFSQDLQKLYPNTEFIKAV